MLDQHPRHGRWPVLLQDQQLRSVIQTQSCNKSKRDSVSHLHAYEYFCNCIIKVLFWTKHNIIITSIWFRDREHQHIIMEGIKYSVFNFHNKILACLILQIFLVNVKFTKIKSESIKVTVRYISYCCTHFRVKILLFIKNDLIFCDMSPWNWACVIVNYRKRNIHALMNKPYLSLKSSWNATPP